MKLAMFILQLIVIVAGYIVYRMKFRIDREMFGKIVSDLAERGDFTAAVKKDPGL